MMFNQTAILGLKIFFIFSPLHCLKLCMWSQFRISFQSVWNRWVVMRTDHLCYCQVYFDAIKYYIQFTIYCPTHSWFSLTEGKCSVPFVVAMEMWNLCSSFDKPPELFNCTNTSVAGMRCFWFQPLIAKHGHCTSGVECNLFKIAF